MSEPPFIDTEVFSMGDWKQYALDLVEYIKDEQFKSVCPYAYDDWAHPEWNGMIYETPQ